MMNAVGPVIRWGSARLSYRCFSSRMIRASFCRHNCEQVTASARVPGNMGFQHMMQPVSDGLRACRAFRISARQAGHISQVRPRPQLSQKYALGMCFAPE